MSDGGDSGFGRDDGSTSHRDDQASFHTGDVFTDMGQSFVRPGRRQRSVMSHLGAQADARLQQYGNTLADGNYDTRRHSGYAGSLADRTNSVRRIKPSRLAFPSLVTSDCEPFDTTHHQSEALPAFLRSPQLPTHS